MDCSAAIISQYQAALDMLRQTIVQCPEPLWNAPGDKTKFWHIAYHALFYTHLYLQDSAETFTPWAKHRKDYQFIGQVPWPPHTPPQIEAPYDKDSLLEYLAFCQQQVEQQVPRLNIEAASGFDWLPFNKLELQLYNLRHLQQHAGELMERLGTRANIEVHWVVMKPR